MGKTSQCACGVNPGLFFDYTLPEPIEPRQCGQSRLLSVGAAHGTNSAAVIEDSPTAYCLAHPSLPRLFLRCISSLESLALVCRDFPTAMMISEPPVLQLRSGQGQARQRVPAAAARAPGGTVEGKRCTQWLCPYFFDSIQSGTLLYPHLDLRRQKLLIPI